MRTFLLIIIHCFFLNLILAQELTHPEWLRLEEQDTLSTFERVIKFTNYTWDNLIFSDPDSTYQLLVGVMNIAKKEDDLLSQGYLHNQMGVTHGIRGNLNEARINFTKGAELVLAAKDYEMYINISENLAHAYQQGGMLSKSLETLRNVEIFGDSTNTKYDKEYTSELYGTIYLSQNKLDQAKQRYFKAVELYEAKNDSLGAGTNQKYLGDAYQKENKLDSALFYYEEALGNFRLRSRSNACQTALSLGKLFFKIGNLNKAEEYLDQTLSTALELSLNDEITGAYIAIGQLEKQKGNRAQAIKNYENALQYAKEGNHLINQEISTVELYQLSKELNQTKKALFFLEQNQKLNDSIQSNEVKKQLQSLDFKNLVLQDSIRRENIIETNQLKYESTLRTRNITLISLAALALLLVIFAFFQYRTKRVKENLLEEVQQKNKEVTEINAEIIKTKDQLVVQEKLASLGQLTAGIAHEIKNPLNFITNFAEDSVELIDEIDKNIGEEKAPLTLAKKETILNDIQDIRLNLIDIQSSGKRVDQIINNMMNHTRESDGTRRKEDINELIRINTNFAYQGYRASNRSFFATIHLDFDDTLPEVYVYAQELGRVILNLVNNACYAVAQKESLRQNNYEAGIWIQTEMLEQKIRIKIRDNGVGIGDSTRDKIFNPFFTTKPTGSGNTGLGLSISHEIISTLHEGEISVDSEEGVFTEFIIELPLKAEE